MAEFIEFKLIEEKPKTKVYSVINRKSMIVLGYIKWYGAWRQYCLFPERGTIFNADCMLYIIGFIRKLMEARKK